MSIVEVEERTANRLLEQGDPERAARFLGLALIEGESSAERWNDWATTQLAAGRVLVAEWGYRQSLCVSPRHRQAAINLATLLMAGRRVSEAKSILQPHASSLTPNERELLASLEEAGAAQKAGPLEASSADVLDAFLAVIAVMPNDDVHLPKGVRESNRRRGFDSAGYVDQVCALFEELPADLQADGRQRLAAGAEVDSRWPLVAARQDLRQGRLEQALAGLRGVAAVRPGDLYAQRLLLDTECRTGGSPTDNGVRTYLAECCCERPWEQFELVGDGSVFLCDPNWLPVPAGNLSDAAATELWKSSLAQEIRNSVQDGSFRYCNWNYCPKIAARQLPPQPADSHRNKPGRNSGKRPKLNAPETPKNLVLSHDPSCNLACPQCRRHVVFADATEHERLVAMGERFLATTLASAETLSLSGRGEVFQSRYGRQLLSRLNRTSYPRLRFDLVTNGLGCDSQTFAELDLDGRLRSLKVGVDAASEAVYRQVRHGGDFERLRANLDFLSGLRAQQGPDFQFVLSFVVSSLNYREIPQFVHMAREYAADVVEFSRLRYHTGYRRREFEQLDICHPEHPEHGPFLEIVRAGELQAPYCRWGDLAGVANGAEIAL